MQFSLECHVSRCSKCPPFVQTHGYRHFLHSLMAVLPVLCCRPLQTSTIHAAWVHRHCWPMSLQKHVIQSRCCLEWSVRLDQGIVLDAHAHWRHLANSVERLCAAGISWSTYLLKFRCVYCGLHQYWLWVCEMRISYFWGQKLETSPASCKDINWLAVTCI